MTTITDPNAAADTARALVEERVESIRRAAESQQRAQEYEAQLADLRAAAAADYAAARKAGWSERELAQCGISKLDGTAPRKRRASASRPSATQPPTGNGDGDGSAAEQNGRPGQDEGQGFVNG